MFLQTGTCRCQSKCLVSGSLMRFRAYLVECIHSFCFSFFKTAGVRNLGAFVFFFSINQCAYFLSTTVSKG